MDLDLARNREEAHSLLDGLPEEKFLVVRNLLEVLVEPLSRSLANAPVEEEELTPETIVALNRVSTSLERGEGVSHDEMRRELRS